jgi:hypothetical protein
MKKEGRKEEKGRKEVSKGKRTNGAEGRNC